MACNLRRWKQNNPGKMEEYHAKEYREKKEQVMARLERWRSANPHKWRAIRSNDSSRRRYAFENGTVTEKDIAKLVRSSKDKCFYCQKELHGNFHLDHYIPIVKGGKHIASNIRIACAKCNLSKSAKHPEEFKKIIVLYKPSLIESKARWGNDAEGASHRQRLSEKAVEKSTDAIVRARTIQEIREMDRNAPSPQVIVA